MGKETEGQLNMAELDRNEGEQVSSNIDLSTFFEPFFFANVRYLTRV